MEGQAAGELQSATRLSAQEQQAQALSGYWLTNAPAGLRYAGDTVSITWSAPVGHSSSDWVALAKVGSPMTSYVSWTYTGTATSGVFTTTVPTWDLQADTQFEFRYFLNNGYTLAATSSSFGLNQYPYGFSCQVGPVSSQGQVTVDWTAPLVSRASNDWIGLYRVNEPLNHSYLAWAWAGSAQRGTTTLTLPGGLQPGEVLELRYLVAGGYTDIMRCGQFRIGSSYWLNAPQPRVVRTSREVSVTWNAPANHSSNDFVGLYPAGSFVTSAHLARSSNLPSGTSGTVSLTVPRGTQPGRYQLAYICNGQSLCATSDPFDVMNEGYYFEPLLSVYNMGSTVRVKWWTPMWPPPQWQLKLYRVGSPDSQDIPITYPNTPGIPYPAGTTQFDVNVTLPSNAGRGQFEFRLFDLTVSSYVKQAVSGQFTIP